MRKWIKCVPPKKLQEIARVYNGVWMPQMDRYWESDDGLSVMSRLLKTEWGQVEHVTIKPMVGGMWSGDIPWALKQEIKDELFGIRAVAIEVFPAKKNLVDVADVYHLWVLPKGFEIPFGIHPYKDPQCEPIERGYDFNIVEVKEWTNSPEREAIMSARDTSVSPLEKALTDALVESKEAEIQRAMAGGINGNT